MKAWQTTSDISRSGDEAIRLIRETFRLYGVLMEAGDCLTRESGLTTARWQVLGAVWDGGRTVSAIARSMGLTRQSVQRTVTRLEADGFVELRDNPDHVRARLVILTEKGEGTLRDMAGHQAAWISRLTRDMEPANIRIATGILRGLGSRLRDDAERSE